MTHLINYLKGICIGIANAIPGVSGGTIAFILKIYDRLLDAIDLHPKKLKQNLPFLVTVGLGLLTGVFLAAKVLSYLFTYHNVPTQFFFIGIILGSLPMIFRECTADGMLKPIHILPFILACMGIIIFNSLQENTFSSQLNPVSIIIMSAFSAAAMLLPGLSGALVLKILGGYELAMQAITALDIGTLIFYAIGVAIGLLGAAKLISLLLAKCRKGTYCVILGLIIGSIPQIYPMEFTFNAEGIIAAAVLLVGISLPTVMEKVGSKKTAEKKALEN
ncbi:MAG: DUF368 domain-containing protein [Huintestinicola sp.]